MTGDTILVVVGGIAGAVIASLITAAMMRRSESRADLSTTVRHDAQIAALTAALAELRAETHRQWTEVREWMARMSARMDAMDARLTRLEARLDERDRRGEETKRAWMRESLDGMQEWCATRCDVRREKEGSLRTTTDPRNPRYDGKVEP